MTHFLKDEVRMSSLAQPPMAGPAFRPAGRPASTYSADALAQSAEAAITSARLKLLQLQKPDGHWCGELQGDTILESEYVMLMAYLGQEGDTRVHKAARYILTQVRPDGAWSNYPGGPVDISV